MYNLILCVLFVAIFAFCNRARGSKLYGLTDSTVIGRIAATLGMAVTAGMPLIGDIVKMDIAVLWTWAALMLWCTPAWDADWSATIGNDPAHTRLQGLRMMTLRMTLAAPCIIGLAFIVRHPWHTVYATGVLFLGLPYYAAGYLFKKNPIPASEYSVGAILGTLIFLTLGA